MKPRLAQLLVCPGCRRALRLEAGERQEDEILSGRLDCRHCDLSYPIAGGIPRFVASGGYAASFGFEWKRWRRTQFDSAEHRPSERTFIASTGREPQELAGKLVLDAGCGAGRYLDVAARAGAEVIGVDLSLAVEVAQENLARQPACHCVQADLLQLPFPPATFDFIFSIGVLHHTPDTRRAFAALAQLLKPGGEIAVWVYPRRRLTETLRDFPERVNEVLALDVGFQLSPRAQRLLRPLAPWVDGVTAVSSRLGRAVTTRLPPTWLYALCHAAIPLYYLYRVPLFYPLRLLTQVAMDPDPEWRVLHTFDWYSPRFQWKHTYAEVEAWFKEAGLEDVTRLPRPVAVRGRARTVPE